MSDQPQVLAETANGIAWLTLNRPGRGNTLTFELVRSLNERVQAAENDPSVRVIVLRAMGDDFCRGYDPEYLFTLHDFGLEGNTADGTAYLELLNRITLSNKLVVAQVQGRALSEGAGLTLAADIVWAADDATFGLPDLRYGFIPALTARVLIERLGPALGRQLVLTAETLDAPTAKRLGWVYGQASPADLALAVATHAERLVKDMAPGAVYLTKRLLRDAPQLPIKEGVRFMAKMNAHARDTQEFRQGVAALLADQEPTW